MGPGHRGKAEALGDALRRADFLVEFHAMAAADQIDARRLARDPVGELFRGRVIDDDHGMRIVKNRLEVGERGLQPRDGGSDFRRAPAAKGELRPADVAAIDGETGAVRSAIGQRREHAGRQPAELRLEGLVLEKEADNAAHELGVLLSKRVPHHVRARFARVNEGKQPFLSGNLRFILAPRSLATGPTNVPHVRG